ncbi:hypothetical protein ACFV8T_01545 [Streptomyces sp. NPDC059832]
MTCRGFLAEPLMAECDDRVRCRSLRFRRQPDIDAATIHTLAG